MARRTILTCDICKQDVEFTRDVKILLHETRVGMYDSAEKLERELEVCGGCSCELFNAVERLIDPGTHN